MNSHTLAHNIEANLGNFDQRPLREAATALLNTLGYHSRRTGKNLENDRFNRLRDAAAETAKPTQKLCINDWNNFHILMQVGDEEINEQITNIRLLFQSDVIEDELTRSYIFVTMQLDRNAYTRTQLSNITRFINTHFTNRQEKQPPIMVIFRYGYFLSLAIIDRRKHKTVKGKQVLEKVTLIKDININKPHAAHRNILAELSLERLIEIEGVHNFDTLHKAWANVLNTEPLTREFYSKLYKWYQWAVTESRFQDNDNELQVIRLITRLLFIWFLKEKHLVPSALFEDNQVTAYLNQFDPETSDYYQAILQNLFFATLNTPMDERRFSTETSTYHYADLLTNHDMFLEDLKQVPFVNGGLFDCHVTQECFTDDPNERQNLHVPTKLFFDAENGIFPLFNHYKFTVKENTPIEQEVALDPELLGQVFENLLGTYNPETQTTARRATGSYYTPRQIVEFMVDETLIAYFLQKVTPYDNDRKFLEERLRDDLLAYQYQGEEGEDADHLIHEDEIESLIQSINELKILDPAVGSGAFPMDILNKLVLILQKLDPQNEHWKQQQLQQVSQISDPESRERAKGAIEEVFSAENYYNDYSRKLYLIQNCIYGVDIQPFAITIAKLRFFISLVIEQIPNTAADNYGIRPLPNLETKLVAANTLIGLKQLHEPEIQLLLEDNMVQPLLQQIQTLRSNYFSVNTPDNKQEHIEGDQALRNLLDRTLDLQYEAWRIQEENRIREQVDRLPTESARQRHQAELYREFRRKEAKINEGMVEAKRIAQWNAYDPNAVAEFFEAEYMFGIKDEFDVVIGNPPYIRHERIQRLKPALQIQFEDFFTSTADISVYFYKRAAEFLRDGGILTYISTNKFMRGGYGRNLRCFFTTDMSPKIILDFGGVSVFDAAVDTCILLVEKYLPDADHTMQTVTLIIESRDFNVGESFQEQRFSQQVSQLSEEGWTLERPDTLTLLEKIQSTGNTLSESVAGRLYRGIVTGCNDAFIINADTREWLIDEDSRSDELIKPLFRGRDISKWKTDLTDFYIIAIASSANREWPWSDASDEEEAEQIFSECYPVIFEHLNGYRERLIQRDDQGKFYWELRSCSYYTEFEEPKIVYPDISPSMRACYDTTKALCLQTAYILPTDDFSLLAILNSRLFDWYAKYKFQSLNDPWSGGGLRFIAQYMQAVPITNRTLAQKAELSRIVEQILADPKSHDVPDLEKEIDALVYRLYGLSEAEIALIEQTYRDAGM